MRITTFLLVLPALLGTLGCSRPDTNWHVEKITEDSTSFAGSYQNALDTLRVKSHEWKIIECDAKTDQCGWGFKLAVEFPDHPEYSPVIGKDGKVLGVPVMPISKIEYRLFDADGFYLATLTLAGDSLGVEEKDTRTFQLTGKLTSPLARRAAHGKVTIVAGYVPQPSKQ